MLAFIYATNALYEVDKEAYSRIFNRLDPGVRRDISCQSNYWKQFEGPVADTATSINNGYLQANQQVLPGQRRRSVREGRACPPC